MSNEDIWTELSVRSILEDNVELSYTEGHLVMAAEFDRECTPDDAQLMLRHIAAMALRLASEL